MQLAALATKSAGELCWLEFEDIYREYGTMASLSQNSQHLSMLFEDFESVMRERGGRDCWADLDFFPIPNSCDASGNRQTENQRLKQQCSCTARAGSPVLRGTPRAGRDMSCWAVDQA